MAAYLKLVRSIPAYAREDATHLEGVEICLGAALIREWSGAICAFKMNVNAGIVSMHGQL